MKRVSLLLCVTVLWVCFENEGFAQTSDTTPPQLTALSFSPTMIDTTTGSAAVTVNYTATDDLSGVARFIVRFKSPSGISQSNSDNFTPALNKTGAVVVTIPQFSEAGVWTLDTVDVRDAVNNQLFLLTADLAARGFPTQLNVSLNLPPIANAGTDQTVESSSPAGTPVTLNGAGSSDPNSDPLTYTWTGPFGTATGVRPSVVLPVGTHTITLTVNDGKGGTASDTVMITVRDTTAPIIVGVSANPTTLSPVNGKMVNVTINYSAVDNGTPATGIVGSLSVSSDEPVVGEPDWEIVDAHHVRLRAESDKNGDGRTYTITIRCTDGAGNASTQNVQVNVPKKGKK